MAYFIHRISHEWEVSYPLLELGYLSIGWSDYRDTDLLKRIESGGETAFNEFMSDHNNSYRSRWSLWYFSQMRQGDFVVVPLFDKYLSICEIEDLPSSILALNGTTLKLTNGQIAIIDENGLSNGIDRIYDIGFIVKVKEIKRIPRAYVDAKLVSRMKMRQTNGRIDDLAESVNEAISSEGPINIHEQILSAASDSLKDTIEKYITPDDLEETIRWYFKKKGADRAWIPAKNEAGKENGADADVIAEFDDLGIVYLVQVKNHTGETGKWAVNQIFEYDLQKCDAKEGTTYIPWVVTMAQKFSDEAIELSKQYNIRLITGDELIRMLLNVGLDGIEKTVCR